MYHNAFEHEPICKEIKKNISDNVLYQHHLTVNLFDNRDIQIKNDKESVVLNYIESSKNGLVLYSYEIKEDEDSFLKREIPNAIYHLIKGFYHLHEYHEDTADSLLRAYESDSKVDIKSVNNAAITRYLQTYEEKFQAYSMQISCLYSRLTQNSTKKTEKFKLLENHELFENLCNNSLGEALYCNTLLKSKYVDGCPKSDNSCDLQRKIILNINNAIENIRLMEQKNQIDFALKGTKIAFKNNTTGLIIAVVGILLALCGIYLTVRSLNTPKYAKDILEYENHIMTNITNNTKSLNLIQTKQDRLITTIQQERKKYK